jgi:acetylornithine deacetylase/succinyl-diaminopimelate desuccinylase-like protein
MIASLHDENNHVTIPGFYDDVVIATDQERKLMAEAPFNQKEFNEDLGIAEEWGEKGYTTGERTGIRPTLEVNGMWGGYTGEGAKTVLPSKAFAKISCRLVPNQDSHKMEKLVIDHLKSITPASVTLEAKLHHGGEPYVTPIDSVPYRAAAAAIKDVFGKEPIPVRGGGSIPITAIFEKELGVKVVFLGFGLDSDNLHSPNEKYDIANFYKGIETIPYFHKHFAEMNG